MESPRLAEKVRMDSTQMTTCREFKVLRTLAKADTPIIKAELQRRAKMNHATLKTTLASLEEKELVKVSRYGRFSMIRLNEDNEAIKGLEKFLEESE